MMSKEFWISVLVRAIKTAAQVVIATVGVGATDITSVSWQFVAISAGVAALLSVATSIVAYNVPGLPEADPIGVLADSKIPADVPGQDLNFTGEGLPLDPPGAVVDEGVTDDE